MRSPTRSPRSSGASGRRGARAALASLAALLVVAACRATSGPASELTEARERWRQNRPANYRLTLSVGCFCAFPPQPIEIDVQGDSVIARRVRSTGAPLDPNLARSFPSVDGLFAIVAEARARNAQTLQVSYDPALGYPSTVFIDYRGAIADDEISYTVASVESR